MTTQFQINMDKISRRLLLTAGLTLIVTAILFLYKQHLWDSSTTIDSGKFADFGTFISGLFGVLTIIFIYLTYLQAQATNRTSLTALDITRRDSIDNTFFNLLQSHQAIVNPLHERITDKLKEEYEELNTAANNKYSNRNDKDFFELLFRVLNLRYADSTKKQTIDSFFKNQDWVMGHYFRSLLYFINWIDQHGELTPETKRFYVGFIQAQLTMDEMKLVFYYAISRQDNLRESICKTLNEYDFFNTVKGVLIFPDKETDWNYYLGIVNKE